MTSSFNGTRPADTVRSQLARLAEIDVQAAKLAVEREALIAWFEALEKPVASSLAPLTSTKATNGALARKKGMHPGSFSSRIVAFLEREPSRVFNIGEIYAAVGEGKKKRALRTGLYDLWKRNKIARVGETGNGLYQALPREAIIPNKM